MSKQTLVVPERYYVAEEEAWRDRREIRRGSSLLQESVTIWNLLCKVSSTSFASSTNCVFFYVRRLRNSSRSRLILLEIDMIVLLMTLALGVAALWWYLSPDKRLREMGNKIPGPRSYPIVGNIFNFNFVGVNAPRDWADGMKRFGSTFKFWLGPQLHIFITDPEDIQMILTSQTLITKSQSYESLTSWLGSGLLISTGNLWQRRRKAITPTFHFKILDEFIPTFNKCSSTLVNLLKSEVGKGYFPLNEYMSNCALDAVAETAMGTEIKAQTEPLGEYPTSIVKMTKSLMEKIGNPLLGMEPLYTISGRRMAENNLLKILFALPLQVIRKKESEQNFLSLNSDSKEEDLGVKKKTAFLEFLLKLKHEKAISFETEKDIKDEVMTFMFEGHDTTTMSLTFTTWLIGVHQKVQEELYREVSAILVGQEPTMEDYQKMNYLERVIKESLRLYPSVPIIARMATHDVTLPSSGYVVPAGAHLNIVFQELHRNPELFPDPLKFDPDRFLEKQKHNFAYVPFSAGPRNCIGQKFAMLDMKVIISHLVLNYKIESDEDVIMSPELVLRAVKGPRVKITPRNN